MAGCGLETGLPPVVAIFLTLSPLFVNPVTANGTSSDLLLLIIFSRLQKSNYKSQFLSMFTFFGFVRGRS